MLNARNEEAEAAIVARAGERGAVTISTNMAGRGVDIRLGQGVAELGGLHVVGMSGTRAAVSIISCADVPAGKAIRAARGFSSPTRTR